MTLNAKIVMPDSQQVWSDFNVFDFSIVVSLKKRLCISTAGKHKRIIRFKHVQPKKIDIILHVID